MGVGGGGARMKGSSSLVTKEQLQEERTLGK